ncbi:trihelix transcription factor GT-3b-like [Magnolia sinica]|uniref:trihelix transcription factor GT-3b-like n=1 Tax=Magnolia sinica TaxID=86752 RepID=UPI0026590894|nr:trihelix transcription factor GT-3b-like [Magnolia sinica]
MYGVIINHAAVFPVFPIASGAEARQFCNYLQSQRHFNSALNIKVSREQGRERERTMLGRGENDRLGLGRMVMMMGQPLQVNQTVEMGGGERVPPPQWSEEETREFIGIRGELERDFKVTKRNKTLWEVVSSKMKERGYKRSPDQCKCKWKNLVNRYKGKETSDPENGRQCPFFDELNAIFTERAKSMQRMLLKSEAGGASQAKKKMRRHGEHSSDEFTEGDDDDDNSEEERSLIRSRKKKPPPQTAATRTTAALDKSRGGGSSIQEILQDVFQQQQQMEMQWQEAMERRAQERCMFEQEWRQSMEKLETERLLMEQAWREREEQRRMREENRAEKRDALLTTLLNRLIHEDLQ